MVYLKQMRFTLGVTFEVFFEGRCTRSLFENKAARFNRQYQELQRSIFLICLPHRLALQRHAIDLFL